MGHKKYIFQNKQLSSKLFLYTSNMYTYYKSWSTQWHSYTTGKS